MVITSENYKTVPESLAFTEEGQQILYALSDVKREQDGANKTPVLETDTHNQLTRRIWLVTKDRDSNSSDGGETPLQVEALFQAILASIGVAPEVFYTLGKKTWLGRHGKYAILQERMDLDFIDAFQGSKDPSKKYYGRNKSFGAVAGKLLVVKCCRMGAICVLHADMKSENFMINVRKNQGNRIRDNIIKLAIIDYDPKFLYIGCDCLKNAVDILKSEHKNAAPNVIFSTLNLLMIWFWFFTRKISGRATDAEEACGEVIKQALEKTTLPLYSLEQHLPRDMLILINDWKRHYGDKEIQERMPFHRRKEHTWMLKESFIHIACQFFPKQFKVGLGVRPIFNGLKIETNLTCCELDGETSCPFKVTETRKKLQDLAHDIKKKMRIKKLTC